MRFLKMSLFWSCFIFLASCSDNEDFIEFSGEWHLDSISGGIGGGGFGFDGGYKIFIDGDDLKCFHNDELFLMANICPIDDEYYDFVVEDIDVIKLIDDILFGNSDEMIIQTNNKILILSNLCNDCYYYHFIQA